MKGKYKKPDGSIVEIYDFDQANKIAYVGIGSGQYNLYSENEYSTWVKEWAEEPEKGEKESDVVDEITVEETIPDEVIVESDTPSEETAEDKPKKKRTYKKKEK